MPHITIKRPEGHTPQLLSSDRTLSSKAIYQGSLTRVGEIRHGIKAQYPQIPLTNDYSQFSLRTFQKNHNYLQCATTKNSHSETGHEQDSHGLNKQHQLQQEKRARKGQDALINHVINYIKNAARHGQEEVSLDIAEILDSFRHYRQPDSFDPHEHTRCVATWLQSMMIGSQQNTHTVICTAVITGLRAAGYKDAKIEKKYQKKMIKTERQHQHSINSDAFNQKISAKTQLVSIPFNTILVSTSCAKTPHLDNLNPKTRSVIRNKIPSWIGSIFT